MDHGSVLVLGKTRAKKKKPQSISMYGNYFTEVINTRYNTKSCP